MNVVYSIKNFRVKNKDEIPRDVEICMENTKNQIVLEIWTGHQNYNTNKKVSKFLGYKFRKEIQELM